mgnify:CR=1 FL=1
MKEIKKVAPVPLVLHGGSNNPDDEIAESCRIGISKINISSDFKSAYFAKVKEVLDTTGGICACKSIRSSHSRSQKGYSTKNGIIQFH